MLGKKSGWSVKKIFRELAISLLLLFVISETISYLRQPDIDSQRVPEINARLVDGSRFETPGGKPLVIHFWGNWCPVCKLEAPNIQRVSERYEVLTIAVNSGDDKKIRSYMDRKQLHFNVLNDRDGQWAKHFKVEVFPTTFIYDAEGKLRFTEVGYTTTAGLLARLAIVK